MEKTATTILAAAAALVIVVGSWAPVITVPAAQATPVATPAIV